MATTTPKPTNQDISPVDAIWSIIQSQSKEVRQAIFLRIEAEQQMTKVSSCNILKKISELEPGPAGFLKLDSILPPSRMSIEDLRADAYIDKYGI